MMRAAIPEECFPRVPGEITPELARSRPDKMNVLFHLQLLSRSVSDADSAVNLLMDLAKSLVAHDKAVLFWREDSGLSFAVRISRGLPPSFGASLLREELFAPLFKDPVRPAVLNGGPGDPNALTEAAARAGAVGLVSMPLYVGEEVLGLLQLYRTSLTPFQPEDVHLLRVFTLAFGGVFEDLTRHGHSRDFAFLDPTTGLFSRRYFEQHLEREIDLARRNNAPVSVVVVRVEDLGRLREQHGRATAEAFLHAIARRLGTACRKSDTLAFYRDDDFTVILPRTGKETLPIVARRFFEVLDLPHTEESLDAVMERPRFRLSAVSYPEDAFAPDSMIEAAYQGLDRISTAPDIRYHQYPPPKSRGEDEDILDASRLGLFQEALADPGRLLHAFARLCLDAVPADRVSILVREGDALILQVAIGFNGQQEVVRATRIPLSGATVTAWVAQAREPVLVRGPEDRPDLPRAREGTYRSPSFFSVPLVHRDELLGVIHFADRSDGSSFSEADLEAFRPLARVMSHHLHQARHFCEAQEDFLQDALFGLVDLVEQQVPGMEGHSQEVARLVEATARRLGHAEAEVQRLRVSSRLHDLGKASFRSRILSEPRALSPRERALAQRHPLLGWKFLEGIALRQVDRDAILYHHEREDGSGYFGKQSDDIPASAKILAAADVYQALVSPRPYRPALARDDALSYLRAQGGRLFDERVVEALSAVVEGST